MRENNQAGNFTHTWTYDSAGNITARTEYAYTTGELGTPTDTVAYTYGNTNWGDLLTAYDGTAFTYETTSDGNTIGNLLSDGTWTYTWQHGRQLASMTDGTVTWLYTYNADGMRTKRTNGAFVYEYVYNGSQLSRMTVSHRTSRTLNTLYFAYDASGTPMAVTYNNTVYYYVTNIQGDVIAITDNTGLTVATYDYDAWGNILSTDGTMKDTLGTHNPLRYRGYVYDTETGLYYLQSRYYNPEIGRFINADALVATGQGLLGNNMFSYCLSNPVGGCDPNGMCSYSVYTGGNGCYRCLNKPYIDDQEDKSVSKKRLGVVNVSHAGCGPIAVYNAAVTLGMDISFADVLLYYNCRIFDMDLLGIAGTSPELIIDFFEAQGYIVLCTSIIDSIDAVSPLADASIMYYKFPATYCGIEAYGAHFTEYLYISDGYYAHNVTYGNTFTQPSEFVSRNSRYDAIGIFIFEPAGG